MSHFAINLGQTAEDSDMFTNIWLSSIGLKQRRIEKYTLSARWRHHILILVCTGGTACTHHLMVLATICYFHEAQVAAKNSSKQLICLLDDIVPFYIDLTVYTTLCLTAPISMTLQ